MVLLLGVEVVIIYQKSVWVKIFLIKIIVIDSCFLKSSQKQFYVGNYLATAWTISKIHEELYAEWHDTSEPISGFQSDLGLGRIL